MERESIYLPNAKTEYDRKYTMPNRYRGYADNQPFSYRITSTVEDWLPGDSKDTNNSGGITAIHLAALTFSQSNIYRIYHDGKPMAEVCKEYLKSDQITSRAIVAYPVKEDETSNLSKGVVLKLLDDERAISGGSINWNTDDSSFAYTEGNHQSVDKFYLNEKGEILLEEAEDPISIDIASYTIRDIRREILMSIQS